MTYLCSISQCMGRIYLCVEINKMTLTIKCLFFERMKQDVKNKSCANNEENWYSKKFRNIAKSLPLLQAFKNYYRLKNMLVCHHPGPLFPEHPAGQEFFFFSFWDGKKSIDPYLLNLIFEFFALLHFFCFLLQQCTHCHY